MKPYILFALSLLLATADIAQAAPPGAANPSGRLRGEVIHHGGARDGAVVGLNLPEEATDADLGGLCELRGLRFLGLAGTGVSDEGLTAVADLRGLDMLILSRTGVTDAG